MEFLVLGPPRVSGRGGAASRGPRQRPLVASLLLHANEIPSTDRLLGLVWGENQLEPAALRCQLANSPDTCAAFHIAATGYEIEPCPALE